MPTYQELAQRYAERLQSAIREDGFTRVTTLSEAQLRSSATLRALKKIKDDIDGLVVEDTGESLSESNKWQMYRLIAEELGLSRDAPLRKSAMSASNDDLADLVNDVEALLDGKE